MKIEVIFTGGTISSSLTDKGISVDESSNTQKLLINNYYKNTKRKDIEFIVSSPINVLSENMTISDINVLINTLKEIDFSVLDGLIIAHGTDTLAYTANILSILLSGISIPVVLVSSNYVLDDERANGNDNFLNAVTLIENKIPGIFAVYKNDIGKNIVYLASRLCQCQILTNRFSSAIDVDFGEILDNELIIYNNLINPKKKQLLDIAGNDMLLYKLDELKRCVLIVKPYTSIDYDTINLTNNINAVVHYVYHGKTACTAISKDYNSSILTFYNMCKKRNIDLFIAPLEKKQVDNYATNNEMLSAGIQCLYDISEENAFAKLLVAYSLNNTVLRDYVLNCNIFYEDVSVKYN